MTIIGLELAPVAVEMAGLTGKPFAAIWVGVISMSGSRVTTMPPRCVERCRGKLATDWAILMSRSYRLGEKPLSQFTSVTNIFRALIDLPADLHAVTIGLHGRKTQ